MDDVQNAMEDAEYIEAMHHHTPRPTKGWDLLNTSDFDAHINNLKNENPLCLNIEKCCEGSLGLYSFIKFVKDKGSTVLGSFILVVANFKTCDRKSFKEQTQRIVIDYLIDGSKGNENTCPKATGLKRLTSFEPTSSSTNNYSVKANKNGIGISGNAIQRILDTTKSWSPSRSNSNSTTSTPKSSKPSFRFTTRTVTIPSARATPVVYNLNIFDELEHIVFTVLKDRHLEDYMQSEDWYRYQQLMAMTSRELDEEEDFFQLRVMGRGGFGLVHACKKANTGKLYAMKAMSKQRIKMKQAEALVLMEREILTLVPHSPYLVNLIYSFTSPSDVYLILDLMIGGDLGYHLSTRGKFSIQECKYYTVRTVLGIAALHAMNIVHRDIKPDNILMDIQGCTKLTDFGLACFVTPPPSSNSNSNDNCSCHNNNNNTSNSAADVIVISTDNDDNAGGGATISVPTSPSPYTARGGVNGSSNNSMIHNNINNINKATATGPTKLCGTRGYWAPEMLRKPRNIPYTVAVDWFSLGVCVYQFLTGIHPFHAQAEKLLQLDGNVSFQYDKAKLDKAIDFAILQQEVDYSLIDDLDARDFVQRLLCKTPQARLGYIGKDKHVIKVPTPEHSVPLAENSARAGSVGSRGSGSGGSAAGSIRASVGGRRGGSNSSRLKYMLDNNSKRRSGADDGGSTGHSNTARRMTRVLMDITGTSAVPTTNVVVAATATAGYGNSDEAPPSCRSSHHSNNNNNNSIRSNITSNSGGSKAINRNNNAKIIRRQNPSNDAVVVASELADNSNSIGNYTDSSENNCSICNSYIHGCSSNSSSSISNGVREIMNHPWLHDITWSSFHTVAAPWKPDKNHINMKNQTEIGEFNDLKESKKVILTEQDQLCYSNWHYVCHPAYENEIVEFLLYEEIKGPFEFKSQSSCCIIC